MPQTDLSQLQELNQRAWEARHEDVALAQSLSEQAHEVAVKIKNQLEEALSLRTLSYCYAFNGIYDKALLCGSDCIEILGKLNQPEHLARATRVMTRTHWQLGDYSTSLDYSLRTLELAQQCGNHELAAHTYINTALTYVRLGDFTKVDEMLYRALVGFESLNDKRGMLHAYNNLAMLQIHKEEFDNALESARKGWELVQESDLVDLKATLLDTFGQIYTKLGEYEKALDSLSKALEIAIDNKSQWEIINADLNITRIFLQQGRNADAIARSLHALQLCETLNSQQVLLECHELLANCYEADGDYQTALTHHRTYHQIHQTVFAEERDRRIANLEVSHRTHTAQKEAEIYRQKNDELKHEIAERIRIEEQLTIAKEVAEEATRFKSEFLANMSHEIRTPMNGVLGMTQLLMETSLTPEQNEYVQTIWGSGDALLTIINDILDFSKIEAGKLELESEPFELANCVEEVMDLLAPKAHEKELEIFYNIAPSLPQSLVGDVTRLRQILLNLLSNAIKFTNSGYVQLNVDLSTQDKTVHTNIDDGQSEELVLHISVLDTGIGIGEEGMRRLFQSYGQADTSTARRYGGTGLGLTISRQLCQLMGGEMWVESEVGSGSYFQFTIVVHAAPAKVANHSAQKNELQGFSVAILEDHAGYSLWLAQNAQKWQMTPSLFENGAQARNDWATTDAKNLPDIIWLDHTLPDVDSYTFIQSLRESPKLANIPVLVLLPRSHQAMREQLSKLDKVQTIYKPAKQNELSARSQGLLGQEGKAQHRQQTRGLLADNASMAESHPLRILLVEDNKVNQKVATAILGRLGYEIELVEDGVEAVALAHTKPFDVILMDVHLPTMDGYQATQEIRQYTTPWPQPTIVALTASALSEERQRCLDAGMNAFLSKPIQLEELVGTLKAIPSVLSLSTSL